MEMKDKKIFICACSSLEHLIMFWDWPESKEVYIEVHLRNRDNFFKRLWYGLKYTFGYKSRFGAFDEFIFAPDDLAELKEWIKDK
jgi:hypothetical protein